MIRNKIKLLTTEREVDNIDKKIIKMLVTRGWLVKIIINFNLRKTNSTYVPKNIQTNKKILDVIFKTIWV